MSEIEIPDPASNPPEHSTPRPGEEPTDLLENSEPPDPSEDSAGAGLQIVAPRRRRNEIHPERSPIVIAMFREGYAAGWKFAVPESFREALDIRYTPRQVDKNIEYIWTQGQMFNFTQGSILYDTPLAYEGEWEQALRHITLFVQVSEASPSSEDVYQTIQIRSGLDEGDLEVSVTRADASAKTRKQILEEGMTIRRTKITLGEMKFKVFRPKPDRSGIDEVCTIACNQENFVKFLQTGVIRGTDKKLHDLFKEVDKLHPVVDPTISPLTAVDD